jgi:hypothetical protein
MTLVLPLAALAFAEAATRLSGNHALPAGKTTPDPEP